MTLLETKTLRGTRYYLDGKRISRALVVALKADHKQDCFVTVVSLKDSGDTVRNYSCLSHA